MTRAAHIRGLGLTCALGRGVDACARALDAAQTPALPLELGGLDEPVRMPYYRFGAPQELFTPGRFLACLSEAAEEALAEAGLDAAERGGLPLFVGSTGFGVSRAEGEYLEVLRRDPGAAFALPRVGFQEIPERLRETLGVGGESFVFNTACTASAMALEAARRWLSLGRSRHALVVGVELANRTTLAGFSGLQLLSQALRPFDRRRDGIVLGEALAAVVLSAEPAGGLSLVAGASNVDTHSVTTANPDGGSIAALLRALLRQAGAAPRDIVAVKAHGTGSPLNDTGEAAGLRQVFERVPPLMALKPYLGHTLGACGAAELALLAGALRRGRLPATPGFGEEDPQLGLRPLTESAPAPDGLYLLNYFGFGGNNTALLLRKAA